MPDIFDSIEKIEDGWEKIRNAINSALRAAESLNPDFLTGHSLGGALAEVVSSYTKIPGFSFNCPGPVGIITETSFLNPDRGSWEGVVFEPHLRRGDPVSQLNDEHHINSEPIWHEGVSHRMEELVKDIKRDQTNKCFGCFGPRKVKHE
jgi:hypothetical protein